MEVARSAQKKALKKKKNKNKMYKTSKGKAKEDVCMPDSCTRNKHIKLYFLTGKFNE